MGKAIFILLALGISAMIFRAKGIKKLPWYFFGILFFPTAIGIIPTPATTFPRFILYALVASTVLQHKRIIKAFKKFPLKWPLIILFVSLLVIGAVDKRLEAYLRIYRPLMLFIEDFFPIFITYFLIKSEKDLHYVFNTLVGFFFIMAIYGFMNKITGRVEYFSYITNIYGQFDAANLNTTGGRSRFRISSFTNNPIYYGFLLAVMLLIMMFIFNTVKKIKFKKFYILTFLMLLANLFLTNSRTPLISFMIGASLFSLFAINLQQKIRMGLVFVLLALMGVTLFPDTFKIVDQTIDTFTSDDSGVEGGSTLAMRQAQLAASMVIFYTSPVVGHGLKYIVEDLGFSGDADQRESDSDLKGFESYAYSLLIEQGIVGIGANVVFFFTCYQWLRKRRKYATPLGKKYIILCFSLFAAFILFIFGTGALGTFIFFMSIMGMLFKAITINDKRLLIPVNNNSKVSSLIENP